MARAARDRISSADHRLLERARTARRESKGVDFKEQFDPLSDGEWLELVKDIVAMANSGGGALLIGVQNDGTPSGADVRAVLRIDMATPVDKVFRYTGDHFNAIEVVEDQRDGSTIAILLIGGSESPLVFTKPGTYAAGPKGQRTAFGLGTVYVRHGAKSDPATGADLRAAVERRIETVRREWLRDIRRIVTAPTGTEIALLSRIASDERGRPVRFRFTDDPEAPLLGRLDPDQTHPYRQKELIAELNKRLPKHTPANSYDVQCARRAHSIDVKTHPEFIHQPKYGSPQYSDDFVDWLVGQCELDPAFFVVARQKSAR
jgi:hypothetical protein